MSDWNFDGWPIERVIAHLMQQTMPRVQKQAAVQALANPVLSALEACRDYVAERLDYYQDEDGVYMPTETEDRLLHLIEEAIVTLSHQRFRRL